MSISAKVTEVTPLLTRVALSSHYFLRMNGLPGEVTSFLASRGVPTNFINGDAGLLCYEATLPGSSLATADIYGDFMGVTQKYAHSRMYDQLTLGFYCDLEYKMLKLFEHWIEFIADGSGQSKAKPGYFVRMRYPNTYKCASGFSITKFEKDKKVKPLEYNFFNVFPVGLSATPVSYDGSQVLRVNVTLSYDTYQCGKASSSAVSRGEDGNKNPATTGIIPPSIISQASEPAIQSINKEVAARQPEVDAAVNVDSFVRRGSLVNRTLN